MKKFFKLFGIVALAAVFGFSMAACDEGSSSSGSSTGYLSAPTLTGRASGTVLTLSWSSVSGARAYNLYARIVGSSWNYERVNATSDVSNFAGYEGYTLEFKVAAVNSSGTEGAMSNTVSWTVGGGSSNPTPTPTPPSTNTSLEGYWEMTGGTGTNVASGSTPGNQAAQVYVSGNTGYLSRSTNSPLWQDDMNKGGVKVGEAYWKDLRNTGNLAWSGNVWIILVKNSSPNVAYAHGYNACTITMSSNGQNITVKYTWTFEGSSGTSTTTWKRL
jgi:hypothetical protein